MRWKDLKIGYKIGIGFTLMIFLTAVVGAIAIFNMNKIKDDTHNLAEQYIPTINESFYIDKFWHEIVQYLQAYNTSSDQYYIKEVKTRLEKFSTSLEKLIKVTSDSKKLENTYKEFLIIKDEVAKFQNLINEYEKVVIQNNLYLTNIQSSAEIIEKYAENEYNGRNGALNEIMYKADKINSLIFKAVYLKTPAKLEKSRTRIENLVTNIENYKNRNRNIPQELDTCLTNLSSASNSIIDNFAKAKKMELANNELSSNIMWTIRGTSDVGIDQVKEMGESTNKRLDTNTIVLAISAIIVLLLGIIFAIVITNSIALPIERSIMVANYMAEGDLTHRIEINRGDQVGMLTESLNKLNDRLRTIISNISENADYIAESSQVLSLSATEIAEGARQQASATEEISSSMEEMYANIQQTTDNAQQTEAISRKSVQEVNKNTESFKVASQSLKQIADKVNIIDEIAFQTNILALNAAVEAARAGEHGRGFAVVAGEVRKLAEKSKSAAGDINSVSKSTLNLSQNAEKELQSLAPEIERTAKLVQEIAASSIEQVSGIEQINNAMQQLNSVVQSNAQRSDDMATHSEKLAKQADELRDIIGTFKI